MAYTRDTILANGIIYADSQNPAVKRLVIKAGDVGIRTNADDTAIAGVVNVTVSNINDGEFNGIEITGTGYKFRYGQRTGQGLGWVGFGGRGGNNWLWTRLHRVIAFNPANKTWADLSGAPSYSTGNFSHTIATADFGGVESIPVEAVLQQSAIFTGVTGQWRVSARGAKELIHLTQTARNFLQSNTPAGQYAALVYEVDPTQIPKVAIQALLDSLLDSNTDVDDEGQHSLELRTLTDQLIAALPVSDAYVVDGGLNEVANGRQRLRKRLFHQNGKHYLAVGMTREQLAALPGGAIVYDPTITNTISTGANDAEERTSDGTVRNTSTTRKHTFVSNPGIWSYLYFYFPGITIPDGATIDAAKIQVYLRDTTDNDMDTVIYAHDVSSPTVPTGNNSISTATRSTAGVTWQSINIPSGSLNAFNDSPSLVSIINELMASYSYASGRAIGLIFVAQSGTNAILDYAYDQGSSFAASLVIDYTAGGGGATRPWLLRPRHRMRQLLVR